MPARRYPPITYCERLISREDVQEYIAALRQAAPSIGNHGLSPDEFWRSGLFESAIESLRGTRAAGMTEKRAWVGAILDHLETFGEIRSWSATGSHDRHDFEVTMPDGKLSIIETKGCLDGNNTNIFERPLSADEFVIWSLCQNVGSDPRHNAWSGIHTRLGPEVIHRRQRVDGVIIWDMVCGTAGRPCPKVLEDPSRRTVVSGSFPTDLHVPPPCLYLFPRTIPDPRTNPRPSSWRLEDVSFLHALWRSFQGQESDVVSVELEARMNGTELERRTTLVREGVPFQTSSWSAVRRART